ncbi:putative brevis radix (BRX) domain-containing protein [Helianthus annuus]|uniref:Brevis radix (BRX) domain-containing protein n=1 Tax=Helianthus annuus TaxID=4232 RepID=A0A9K3HBD1_HELAN|nr:putative brevis radix (BRX) domain-containing protein [Helianthus annuus]KAJ0477816.1 putative brevis radix (BRX) domain, protein BREVIS RADIX [Helianthus annuus]KAJ0482401.1 putative brevis radix (BRX) domain-containing protein [Helianthus annuus]KAJ0498648.1 putative brevis radix (BRX) domain, protein BREVIS RADIX [Helianthus annuus]KAJ0664661.1 putative brevis radix (BRX) domain, protein BREVIS RADIX [Helianthus annuus]
MSEVVSSLCWALSFQKRKVSPNQRWITISNAWSLLTLRSSGAAESKEINDNTVINQNIRVTVPAIVTEVVDQREALKGQDQNQSRTSNSRSRGGGSRVELPHLFMLAAAPTQEGENEDSDTSDPEDDSDDNVAEQVDAEWAEQCAPGVFVTLMILRDGTKDIQRVHFRYYFNILFPK